ncbi:MAG TPA: glucose-6-phosphate dehydrogenase assembly protein OpcA [Candidatus Limnocylindrales bacterium]|nr:glucose-6-phosphate dehydrogenase assembly protein OpcA [Candidatus Limnocylindrales bacterium]
MTERPSAGGNGSGQAERELAVHRRLMEFGEAETRVAPVWSEQDTSVGAVGAHLARLWSGGAGEGAIVTEEGLPHARASVLNLIVTVSDADAAGRVVQALGGLGFRHPSRAIVLVADPAARGASLDAAVSAHCRPSNGSSEQVCYEEVVLTVRGEAAEHLDGIVAPLLIHDLPTHVWWPGDPPFTDEIFDQVVEVGDRVIIDSADFDHLLLGFRRVASLRRRSGIGDLSWRRIGWWQELTAQFFDAPRFRRYLPNLNRVRIRYALPDVDADGPASPIAQAMLYAGWVASRLDWKRHSTRQALVDGTMHLVLEGRYAMVDLELEGVSAPEVPAGELVSVRLQARGETGAAEFIVDREGHEATVASNADGMTALLRRVRMEPPSEAGLLSVTLSGERKDPVYEAAVRAAAVFLASARPTEATG